MIRLQDGAVVPGIINGTADVKTTVQQLADGLGGLTSGFQQSGAGGSHPQWEKDPPRKLVARRMVEVMNKINKESFGGRQVVTCWTCHRGTTPPATTPGIDAIYSDPVQTLPDLLPQASAGAVVP